MGSTKDYEDAKRAVRASREAKNIAGQTVWDNPRNDPNKRLSCAEDPDGTRNSLS